MATLHNLCRFYPNAAGTTDWVYFQAVTGYQGPTAAGLVSTDPYHFHAESIDRSQWELAEGVVTFSGGFWTFARTKVLCNSAGTGTAPGQTGAGTKINFTTTPQIAVVALAEDVGFKAIDGVRGQPDAAFNWLPGTIYSCPAPGEANDDIDVYEWFVKTYQGSSGWNMVTDRPNYNATSGDTFVSWVNGNDANPGRKDSPRKTVKVALQNSTGQIWMLDGYSKEDLNLLASDRLIGGVAARPMLIRAYDGPRSFAFLANDLRASDITWTVDGVVPPTYTAGTNPTKTLLAVLYRTPALHPLDPEAIGGYRYEPLPHVSSKANTATMAVCWTVESGKPCIRLGGLNVETLKNNIIMVYSNNGLLTDADATMQGTTLYWENIDFIGCKMPYIINDPAHVTFQPVNVMKGCNFLFGEFNNFHAEGAITYFQNCDSWYALNSDGFNIYPRTVLGATVPFRVLTKNCDASHNGDFIQKTPYNMTGVWSGATAYNVNDVVTVSGVFYICSVAHTNHVPPNASFWVPGGWNSQGLGASARNCQGFSAHLDGTWVSINDGAHGNFGQNIAHVVDGNPASTQKVWIIGPKIKSPYGSFVNGQPADVYPNVQCDGLTWLDTPHFSGLMGLFAYNNASGAVSKSFRPAFSANSGPTQILGTLANYNSPASP